MIQADPFKVPLTKLRRVCDIETELAFCTTSEDVSSLHGVIGQERAERSMQFGLAMDAPGYNIFVVGLPGTGKSTYVQAVVDQRAAMGKTPDDWCYINNFSDKDRPLAVSLPAGQGRVFQKDMDELVTDLQASIPKAFEGSDYEQHKGSIIQGLQDKMQAQYRTIEKIALEAGFLVKQTTSRLMFVPLREGKPLSSDEFEKLPVDERQAIEARGHQLEKRIEEMAHESRNLEKQAKNELADLERQIASGAARPLIDRLKQKYNQNPKIQAHLDIVLGDIGENLNLFRAASAESDSESEEEETEQSPLAVLQEDSDAFVRYKVNLFISHDPNEGVPVIVEPLPCYYNLFGKIEYKSQMFSLSTDFTMVRPGAIHRANGGYLILQAKDVLTEPLAWETLKKALKYRQAVVENLGEQYRYAPTVTLRQEPIPLNVKVILIGSPYVNLIYTLDEDFAKLFKVKVDFDVEMPRTPENVRQYVAFVSSLCRRGCRRHFNQRGLAQIIEYGSRLAGNQNKLSTRFNDVNEIVYESVALAEAEGAELVDARHVDEAFRQRQYRANKIEEKLQEMMLQGQILIETTGAVVGQINGLAVVELSGYSFGRPTRITAVTYLGRGGVVNIERETDMSGNIHSRGVLTLAGYLGARFAQDKQLALTAQITFEQNYEEIDGDSASSAELYALLSSLAEVALRQDLAVTGSVDQRGVIQPIGGATEKIEGFFALCKARGLTGSQGVIIPALNIDNLMLNDEVLTAVAAGQFTIYAVRTIDEGIELLTGLPAGSPDAEGQYPPDSIFGRINARLEGFNEILNAAANETP